MDFSSLCEKEVVDISSGIKLGYVENLIFDEARATISRASPLSTISLPETGTVISPSGPSNVQRVRSSVYENPRHSCCARSVGWVIGGWLAR